MSSSVNSFSCSRVPGGRRAVCRAGDGSSDGLYHVLPSAAPVAGRALRHRRSGCRAAAPMAAFMIV